jgi:hypothetical protein
MCGYWGMTLQEPPSREDVATRWRAVARGEVPREAVSSWAEPLMFASYTTKPDLLVMQGLQYLHGFDLSYHSNDQRLIGHGPPGDYIRTLEEVAEEFTAWEQRCAAYDENPAGWIAARRRDAEGSARHERDQS